MKRYKITTFDYDTTPNILSMEIKSEWEDNVKKSWEKTKTDVKESYKQVYGENNIDLKISNAIAIGASPVCVIAFHNKFLKQIRHSFIVGSYYPSLTGACALGERILNHLLINLKNSYKESKHYKKIYNKQSLDDWDKMIEILKDWNVLLDNTIKPLEELKKIRHTLAIHFNPSTDTQDRQYALNAIKNIQEFISTQFASFSLAPWFIENTKGEFFIKKEWENNPFVQKIYLPNCALVGPRHKIINQEGQLIITDNQYKNVEISDEEFIKLRDEFKTNGSV